MSLEFLAPDATRPHDGAAPTARSPLEPLLERAGARFAARDGWSVATGFGSPDAELEGCRSAVALADRSQLGKLELQGGARAIEEIVAQAGDGARLGPGVAARAADAWWCPITAERVLVLTEPARTPGTRARLEELTGDGAPASLTEVTAALAAIAVVGPLARDLFARLTALDLRPRELSEGEFRPGSVARVPAMVLRERGERFLLLCGAAQAAYVWTVAADAGGPLGGAFAGAEALDRLAGGEAGTDA